MTRDPLQCTDLNPGADDYGQECSLVQGTSDIVAVRSPLHYPEMTAFPVQPTSENDNFQ